MRLGGGTGAPQARATAPASPADGPLDLGPPRTFLAAHRARSLSTAARMPYISQPTVTAQVRALEQRLARQLFEGPPRGVAATTAADEPAGRSAWPPGRAAALGGGPAAGDVRRRPLALSLSP